MTQETATPALPTAAGLNEPDATVLGSVPSAGVPPRLERWALTSERQVLLESIVAVSSPRLGSFYRHALESLRQLDDDVRIAVAGHMLRELQDGLRTAKEVKKEGGGAGLFWDWVRDEWEKVLARWPAPPSKTNSWKGSPIDTWLGRFLSGLHREFLRMSDLMPRRRTQNERTLSLIDIGFAGAPPDAREALVDTWMSFSDVFNKATHSTDPDLFEQAVERFEGFLGDRLIPATFEKEAAIADLIQEVEGRV